jgi:hypothetical protein
VFVNVREKQRSLLVKKKKIIAQRISMGVVNHKEAADE